MKNLCSAFLMFTISLCFNVAWAKAHPSHQHSAHQNSSAFNKRDIGLINPERIIYWLEKHNKLAPTANEQTRKQAINAYYERALASRNAISQAVAKNLSVKVLTNFAAAKIKAASSTDNLFSSTVSSTESNSQKVAPQQIQSPLLASESETQTTVKILAVLIDFPDLPFNDNGLSAADSDMYYSSYNPEHYQALIFSPTGFNGPSGQNLPSAYQFYQSESGETFTLTGNVYGWVTADKNASYYGKNSEIDFNDEKVNELVVEAVTKAVAEQGINLADYDKTDFYDVDNDGNLNESDGIVDHLMIFHSSIGEESGGGMLADDAIWSHRFFTFNEENQPVAIPGTNKHVYGYTILPIDAAMGVVAHEFGHDLGLIDEYDLNGSLIAAPVSYWSIMASGAWLYKENNPSGANPSSFSPVAKDFFQQRFQGNWLKQLEVDYQAGLSQHVDLVPYGHKHSGINQIKVNLPRQPKTLGAPLSGQYQFYSGKENLTTTQLSFNTVLPTQASTLTMKARWQIEQDYDYVQITVNGTPLASEHTYLTNPIHGSVRKYISGESITLADKSGDLGWVDLSFDLSHYAGLAVEIAIVYVTDQLQTGYGFVVDDIEIIDHSKQVIFSHDAETSDHVELKGFSRVSSTIEGDAHHYYIHLRDLTDTDEALSTIQKYQPGILVWYGNEAFNDNNVSDHPGEGFIGVVDADQNAIYSNINIPDTHRQIHDASFSLFDQNKYSFTFPKRRGEDIHIEDLHLNSTPLFSDLDDYSASYQPESGLILPKLGFSSEVLSQEQDNSAATVKLTVADAAYIDSEHDGLTVNFSIIDSITDDISNVQWRMGDSEITSSATSHLTSADISYQYQAAGEYTVTATYQSVSGIKTLTTVVKVAPSVSGGINVSVNGANIDYQANLDTELSGLVYRWDFGDDSAPGTSESGNYSYLESGNYQVTLTLRTPTSQVYTYSQTINVTIETEKKSKSGGSLGFVTSLLLLITLWRRNKTLDWVPLSN